MSTTMSFDQLGLSAEILRAVAECGYKEPTPIQIQAIPQILAGKDIMGGAQTGTGKTAGFTLPLLDRLQHHANTSVSPARHPVRALILAPTRELAAQVHESVRDYGKYLPLRSAVVYGGVNMDPQTRELRAGIEILVATPGRLLDHLQQKTTNLSKVEIQVLDEADRMLDMGFLPDIKRILALLPEERQSLMFSATFSEEIRQLADKLLKQPILVEVAKRNAINDLVTHVVHPVSQDRKRELLTHLISTQDLKQALVFVRTRHGASRLSGQLVKDGITATAIHGDKSQVQRTQALSDFKLGAVRVLVATDVAARGLDIEYLPHVINFELPGTPEDYVHRIGRTGRAGSKGEAISLVSGEESELLEGIEKLLKIKIPVRMIDGFDPAAGGQTTSGQHHRDQPGYDRSYHRLKSGQQGQQHRSAYSTVRSGGAESRSRQIPEDPIFSQPYMPLTSGVGNVFAGYKDDDSSVSPFLMAEGGAARSSRPVREKQIAALFMPKQKPSE
jgi:ATP-dependent RNA helicase RhlE